MQVSDVAREKGSFVRWVSELARVYSRGLAAAARKEGLGAEDALDAVQEAFETFLLASEYEGHPSVRRLVHDGYQVITF